MKLGETIRIIPSTSLSKLKLDDLIGQDAIVVEINGTFNNIKGCWVKLSGTYLGEEEWYIPYNSIGS